MTLKNGIKLASSAAIFSNSNHAYSLWMCLELHRLQIHPTSLLNMSPSKQLINEYPKA